MNVDYNNRIISRILGHIQHYNRDLYWKRREYVTKRGGVLLLKYYYLFYIKKCDAFNNASMGTDLGAGATFAEIPELPHGLNGIIIAPGAKIGKHVTIFHQVTIGNDYKDINNTPEIGDNVMIFPGAKIVGKVKIGNNVKIGANAVVTKDVPDNTTVVASRVRTLG